MNEVYGQTGFPSACAEYAEDSLSLDSLFLTNGPAMFPIQVSADSRMFDLKKGDKLIVDRSLAPRSGSLVIAVIMNEFKIAQFILSATGPVLMPFGKKVGDDEMGDDFIWGVVASQHRSRLI